MCDYTEAETGKITAELALYNAVPTTASYLFAYGVSPFLPYSALFKSSALAYAGQAAYTTLQPREAWLKVVDAATGVVRSSRMLSAFPRLPSTCLR